MDYTALKNEFLNDPNGYGYSVYYADGQDWRLAELINQIRDTIFIARGDTVPSYEIFEAIVPTEWDLLSVQEKQRIQLILSMGEISVNGPNTKSAFLLAFGVGTTTRANLIALTTRKGSRAEQLFGHAVSWDDIARARRA